MKESKSQWADELEMIAIIMTCNLIVISSSLYLCTCIKTFIFSDREPIIFYLCKSVVNENYPQWPMINSAGGPRGLPSQSIKYHAITLNYLFSNGFNSPASRDTKPYVIGYLNATHSKWQPKRKASMMWPSQNFLLYNETIL